MEEEILDEEYSDDGYGSDDFDSDEGSPVKTERGAGSASFAAPSQTPRRSAWPKSRRSIGCLGEFHSIM